MCENFELFALTGVRQHTPGLQDGHQPPQQLPVLLPGADAAVQVGLFYHSCYW